MEFLVLSLLAPLHFKVILNISVSGSVSLTVDPTKSNSNQNLFDIVSSGEKNFINFLDISMNMAPEVTLKTHEFWACFLYSYKVVFCFYLFFLFLQGQIHWLK